MNLGNILLICIIGIVAIRIIIAFMGKEAKSGWVTAGSVFGVLALITSWGTINSARNTGGSGATRAIASGITLLFGGGIGIILIFISAVCMFVGLLVAIGRRGEIDGSTDELASEKNQIANDDYVKTETDSPAKTGYPEKSGFLGEQEYVSGEAVGNIDNLMDRGYLCLEDGDYQNAERFFERILDLDARYAPAYIGKLLCILKLKNENQLVGVPVPFEQSPEWEKACRFASDTEKSKLEAILAQSRKAREAEKTRQTYNECLRRFGSADDVSDYSMLKTCFERLGDYADSKDYIVKCDNEIERLLRKRARGIKAAWITVASLVLIVGGYFTYVSVLEPTLKYNNAEKFIREKKYEDAQSAFIELGNYKDAKERVNEPLYIKGSDLETAGDFEGAIAAYKQSEHFKDADDRICALYYNRAVTEMKAGKFSEASGYFSNAAAYVSETTPQQYTDAKSRIPEPFYEEGLALVREGKEAEAIQAFVESIHFKDAKAQICAIYYLRAEREMEAGKFEAASQDFGNAEQYVDALTPTEYSDAGDRKLEPFYEKGLAFAREGKETEAVQAFEEIIGYEDAKAQICAIYYLRAEREMESGEYIAASQDFTNAEQYVDAMTPDEFTNAGDRILEPYYQHGISLTKEGKMPEAMEAFANANGYSDADEQYYKICLAEANRIRAEEGVDAEIAWLKKYAEDSEINKYCNAIIRKAGMSAMENQKYNKAIAYFKDLGEDARELILECHYRLAELFEKNQNPKSAIIEYKEASSYSDASEKSVKVCLEEANRLKAEGKKEEAIEWLSLYSSNKTVKKEYQETVYSYAKESLSNKDYDEALRLFSSIKGFSDVNDLIQNDPHLVRAQRRKWLSIPMGGTITFGRYEQDNYSNNGKEPLEWRVLAKSGNKMLVITKMVVESHYFHTSKTFKSWDKSNVRAWLNSSFLNDAFTREEQEAIALSLVTADINPDCKSVDPGMDTKDKLFLLSVPEVKAYFSSEKDMEAGCSTYAAYQGASWLGSTLWMTRTPCLGTYAPACVFSDAGIQNTDILYKSFYMSATGVRPAMWLDFSTLYFMDDDQVDDVTDHKTDPRNDDLEGL